MPSDAEKWEAFHLRAIMSGDDLSAEEEWLARFSGSVGCGSCQGDWRVLTQAHPPDLSSVASYVAWGINRHNDVNAKAGKPAIPIAAAIAFWKSKAIERLSAIEKQAVAMVGVPRLAPAPEAIIELDFKSVGWKCTSWASHPEVFTVEEIDGKSVAVLAPIKPDNIRIVHQITVRPLTNYIIAGSIACADLVDVEGPKSPRGLAVAVGGSQSRSFVGTVNWTPISVSFHSGAGTVAEITLRVGDNSHTCTGTGRFAGFTVRPR